VCFWPIVTASTCPSSTVCTVARAGVRPGSEHQ
jgi:hypothetical protein